MSNLQDLPRLPRDDPDFAQSEQPLATAKWLPSSTVFQAIKAGAEDEMRSPVVLGQLWDKGTNRLFFADDDRHLVTIAGSRAGKGRSLIIPNLLSYPGSVICIDPKGENAAVSAKYRHEVLGQNVVILDPFGVLKEVESVSAFRGRFNPLEWINAAGPEAIDDVNAVADAIIVRDNDRDPHWNESARAFLKGIILTMMDQLPSYEWEEDGSIQGVNWTLETVRKTASIGLPDPTDSADAVAPSIAGLLSTMKRLEGFNGAISAAGHLLDEMGDSERGGVLSNLRRHTEFLETPAIADNTAASDFDPAKVKGDPTTIYLVLPEWRMGTHSRWLRLVITSLLQGLQRSPTNTAQPATLLILDEFATLGHMESIERAAGYIAGFGVKLWVILQDLSQLKSLYKDRWETFLGNAGALVAFGNVDVTTLDYLSKRLGETEIVRTLRNTSEQIGEGENRQGIGHTLGQLSRGQFASLLGRDSENTQTSFTNSDQQSLQKATLITPDEIARYFSRENESLLVHLAGMHPFRLNRIRYEMDRPFVARASKSPYH
jgi:type IV secretion system protein VirD4